jgi:hypothetical protein
VVLENGGGRPILSLDAQRGMLGKDKPGRDPRRGNICITIEAGDKILIGTRLHVISRLLGGGRMLLRPV